MIALPDTSSARDSTRYASAGILGLLLVSLLTLYLVHAPSMHRLPTHPSLGALHMPASHWTAAYIAAAASPHGEEITTSLQHICYHHPETAHKFTPNLILYLDDANGGIGNIRGNLLDFVFFAMATGSSIVLPSFARRDDTDLSSLFAGRTPFATYFDKEHFVGEIKRACPGLRIYDEGAVAGFREQPGRYVMASMRADIEAEHTVKRSVAEFTEWLAMQGVVMPLEVPTVVKLGRTLWDGPDTFSLGARVRRDFGSLLRHPRVVLALAANATFALARRHGLDLRPLQPCFAGPGYMGAHLRTEKDAENAGWLGAESLHANFSAQTDAYLSQALEVGAKVMYVASGDPVELKRFAEKAWRTSRVNITSKQQLLSPGDLKVLSGLSWDQQALVDYEILKRSSVLGGFVMSSFSYNLAVSRAAVLELERRVVPRRWYEVNPKTLQREDGIAFRDALSVIWGRNEWHEKKIPRGAWP